MAELDALQASGLLGRLEGELRALRATVEALAEEQRHLGRRLLAADDRRVMVRLVPLVDERLQDQVWTAATLYAAALEDEDSALAQLLGDWNTDSGGLRSFGGLLERCAGSVFAGMRLIAVGARDRDGALYQLKRVSGASKPAQPVASRARLADDDCIADRSRR